MATDRQGFTQLYFLNQDVFQKSTHFCKKIRCSFNSGTLVEANAHIFNFVQQQTDRQTDKQTDRHRHTDRQTHRRTDCYNQVKYTHVHVQLQIVHITVHAYASKYIIKIPKLTYNWSLTY